MREPDLDVCHGEGANSQHCQRGLQHPSQVRNTCLSLQSLFPVSTRREGLSAAEGGGPGAGKPLCGRGAGQGWEREHGHCIKARLKF